MSKTTTLHMHHPFSYISLPFLHEYNVRMPDFVFYGEQRNFISLSELKYGPLA